LLESLGTLAYKAVGIATADDVAAAVATVGGRLLVDTKTGPQVGGTGKTFDWRLVEQLCRTRNVILAGGLHPDNIGVALEQLRPYGVDVASGVEAPARPGVKDMHLVRRFIEVIRELDARIDDHA
jgi:phosphoribosylanthranilate isomerase